MEITEVLSNTHGRGKPVLVTVALLTLAVAGGCATPQPEDTAIQAQHATLQPEDSDKWRESQRPVIKERVEGRWEALIKGDFDRVYLYATPEYRAVVTSQQYRGKFGRALSWRLARVVNVSYDDPTVATVSVEVTYRASLPGMIGETIETQSLISEKWVYKNREWWYIAN